MNGQQQLERVEVLVDSLAGACETALNLYAWWSARLAAENRYRRQDDRDDGNAERDEDDDGWDHDTNDGNGMIKCAASTSLEISSYRIRSTYQIGLTLIGGDFAEGDGMLPFFFFSFVSFFLSFFLYLVLGFILCRLYPFWFVRSALSVLVSTSQAFHPLAGFIQSVRGGC